LGARLGGDVSPGSAGKATGKRQPQAGAVSVLGGCSAPGAWFEDELALVSCDPRAVVPDRVDNLVRVAGERDTNLAAPVAARVLDERLEDALGDVRVETDADRRGGPLQDDLDSSVSGEGAAPPDRGLHRGVCVCRPAGWAAFLARGGDEGLESPRELVGITPDRLEGLSVLPAVTLTPEGEVCLGVNPRQRRPELVGELG